MIERCFKNLDDDEFLDAARRCINDASKNIDTSKNMVLVTQYGEFVVEGCDLGNDIMSIIKRPARNQRQSKGDRVRKRQSYNR